MPDADPALVADILGNLEALGGHHAGFRPVHAKGVMVAGTFTPSAAAASLTKAPHATRPSTPVLVRFSIAAGMPTGADNDPHGSSPQGMAVRFQLGDHVHTDIVAHSHNGFPSRTPADFRAFVRAAAASGPGAANPPPVVAFLMTHPETRAFVEAPKPIPSSFARQAFFAITAFRFTNAAGETRAGRFRLRPAAGVEHITAAEAGDKSPTFLTDELTARLAGGPVSFAVVVQLANPGDPTNDATAVWPDDRPEVELGTLSLTEIVDADAPDNKRVIFDPVPRVDGIDPSDDPLIGLRSEIYLLSGRRRRAAEAKPSTSGS